MLKNLNLGAGVSSRNLTKVLAGGAGATFLVGGGILFLMNSHVQELQRTADGKFAEVSSSQQVAKQYQSAQQTYQDTLTRITFLEASVSARSYVPTLLKQLQDLGQSTHLTVNAVRPVAVIPPPITTKSSSAASSSGDTKKKAAPSYDTIDISIDVTGTYADTATFLYDLTRFPKIISVIGAQMHPAGQAQAKAALGAPQVASTLHLIAYVFPDDPTATAVAPTVPAMQSSVVPAIAPGTIAGAAGRAAAGSIGATRAAQARSQLGISTL